MTSRQRPLHPLPMLQALNHGAAMPAQCLSHCPCFLAPLLVNSHSSPCLRVEPQLAAACLQLHPYFIVTSCLHPSSFNGRCLRRSATCPRLRRANRLRQRGHATVLGPTASHRLTSPYIASHRASHRIASNRAVGFDSRQGAGARPSTDPALLAPASTTLISLSKFKYISRTSRLRPGVS